MIGLLDSPYGNAAAPSLVHTEKAGRSYAFFVSFVASLGGFLFGYDLVIISGAQIFLREQFHLTPAQFGFATSSAILGCIAGPSLGAWLCDWIGRKNALLFSALLFAISAIGAALPRDIATFNAFRIIGGVGVGVASVSSPMYIAEISPARSRGRLGVMYQLALSIGALIATVVAYFLAKYLPATTSWRWMFASVVVPVTFFAVLLMFVPQSPRWLAERNRFQEALDVFARTDPGESPQNRLDEIRGSLAQETGSFRELLQPGIRQAMFVGVILAVLNNWTGWSSIGYYLPTLFQRAGYHRAADAIGQNAIVMMGSVLFTFIASRLVDRTGRRPLWLAASGSMCFALILAGLIFQLNISGPAVILVLFLCMAPHAVGLGPLPWLMMSEIFPTRIRARAVAVATTFLWVAGFSGPFAFPILESFSEKTIGSNAGVFWLYAAICIFAFFWGLRFLPETRGRSLEEIAGSWLRIRGGWNGENGR